MKDFAPLAIRSHYSLNQSTSRPAQIAQRCIELGYESFAITDNNSISSAVQIMKACKEACACSHAKSTHIDGKCKTEGCTCSDFKPANIKPILGCSLNICKLDPIIKDATNVDLSSVTVLAKSLLGWKSLIQSVSASNIPERVYKDKPRLSLDLLSKYCGNLVGIGGSEFFKICYSNSKLAYTAKTYEVAKSLVRTDWKEAILKLTGKYNEVFGKGNFYLGVSDLHNSSMPAYDVANKIIRWAGKKLDISVVAMPDSYYCRQEDAQDHRVLLASGLKTTLSHLEKYCEDHRVGFLRSNSYEIPSSEDMAKLHHYEELYATRQIAEQCEVYNVLNNPVLPDFKCPDGYTGDNYLRKLCEDGWKNKLKDVDEQLYRTRLDSELEIILGAGLAGYFLIVADFMDYGRKKGWLLGPGRGSAAGCLISYLSGITSVDPIPYGLLFERFYNSGRNTKDRISFPDIDCDIPIAKREEMIRYVSKRYGADKVSHMVTFGRMQGKSAIKDVLRVHENCSFDEMKKITKHIPGDAEISDDLEEMRKEFGESSIIKWALENNSKELKEWCEINEEGELVGDYALRFEQAIRMEGIKRNAGKHASGIVMAPTPLAELCPMVYDSKTNSTVGGFEMNDMEAIGIPKFDILGLATLDKLQEVQNILKDGHICFPC